MSATLISFDSGEPMHQHHHSDHAHNHSSSNRIGWAFFLNAGFTVVELIGGLLTNSVSIMADAVHDLGDSLSIGLAWILQRYGNKKPDKKYSYGYKRLSLLGALINGLVLVFGSAWVLLEALPRLFNPEMPVTEGMFALAVFGIVINGFAAYKLSGGKTLNERVLNWHLLEDVLGWVAVLIVSIVLMFIELPILDPILSIAFTLFILFNVGKNLKTTVQLFLQAAPDKKMREDIQRRLLSLDLVTDIHHLHFWSLDGEHHVLTAHLTLTQALNSSEAVALKSLVAQQLEAFKLKHTTIEFEFPEEYCRDHIHN